jgi:Nucleotidyltransferase
MDDLASIARLISALRPWLDELVIVGGWAHRLHRLMPNILPPTYQPLRTLDADLAFSATARLHGDIGQALKEAGFIADLSGEHAPPATWYRLSDQGFYAEFLAPLLGSEMRRDGKPNATVTKAGVTAQKLRYVELLLRHPLTVRLGSEAGMPAAAPADVRLPNPVSFIAQKLLIQFKRTPAKQAQGALYVHDTLDLFGRELATLRATWRDQLRPTLSLKTANQIVRLARDQYGTVSDVHRNAARIPQDRALSPERLQAACAYGLGEIFSI